MKNYYSKIILNLCFIFFVFFISACGIFKNPVFVANYPDDIPVIKDQSKIASVIVPGGYSLKVDGKVVFTGAGKNNKLRSTSGKVMKVRIADLLPGTYTFEAEFIRTGFNSTTTITTYSKDPIQFNVTLKAGEVYMLDFGSIFPYRDEKRRAKIDEGRKKAKIK